MSYLDDPYFGGIEDTPDYLNDPYFTGVSYVGERGITGDLWKELKAGTYDAIGILSEAAEGLGFENQVDEWAENRNAALLPDESEYLGKDSWFMTNMVRPAVRSAPITGAIVGAAVTSPYLGAAALGTLGLGTGKAARDEYLKAHPGDLKGAFEFGAKNALSEVATESLDVLTPFLGKAFSIGGKVVADAVKKVTIKEAGRITAGIVAMQGGSEAINAHYQTSISNEAGLTDIDPMDAARQAFYGSILTSGAFSVWAVSATNTQRKSMENALSTKANPETRQAAAKIVANTIKDTNIKKAWLTSANDSINAGEAIDLDTNFVDKVRTEIKETTKNTIEDPINSDPQELDAAIKNELEFTMPSVDGIFEQEMNLIDQITPERAIAMKGSPLLSEKINEMKGILDDTEFEIWNNKLNAALKVAPAKYKAEEIAKEAYTPELPGEVTERYLEKERLVRDAELQEAAEEILRRPLKEKLIEEPISQERQDAFDKLVTLKAQQRKIFEGMQAVAEDSNEVIASAEKVTKIKDLKKKAEAKKELEVKVVELEAKKTAAEKAVRTVEQIQDDWSNRYTEIAKEDEELRGEFDKLVKFRDKLQKTSEEMRHVAADALEAEVPYVGLVEPETYLAVPEEGIEYKPPTELDTPELADVQEALDIREERAREAYEEELPVLGTAIDLGVDIGTVQEKKTTMAEKKTAEKIPYVQWDTQADVGGKTGEGVNGITYVAQVTEKEVEDPKSKTGFKTIRTGVEITAIGKDGKVISTETIPAKKNLWNLVDKYVEKQVAGSPEGKALRESLVKEKAEVAKELKKAKGLKKTVKSIIRRRKGVSVLKTEAILDLGPEKQNRKLNTWTRDIKGTPYTIQRIDKKWYNKDTEEYVGSTRDEAWDNLLVGKTLEVDEAPITKEAVVREEPITGVELLDRTIADSRTTGEVKVLAQALLANTKIRNKLSKIPVTIGETKRSRVIGGKRVEMSSLDNTFSNLHEAVHAITVREMAANPEVKKEVVSLMELARKESVAQGIFTEEEVAEISKDDPTQWNKDGKWYITNYATSYGLRNEREFLAQSFGSREFRGFLEEIQLPTDQQTGTLKTMWDAFLNMVYKALGLSKKNHTALHKALKLTVELGSAETVATSKDISESPLTYEESVDLIRSNRDQPVVSRVSSFLTGAADVWNTLTQPMTEGLRSIDPKLIKYTRRMELGISNYNVKYHKEIKPFIDFYKALDPDKKLLLSWSLKNTDAEAMKIRKEILGKEYKAVEEVIKGIYNRMEKVGLNTYSENPDYFPRVVSDVDGLMKFFRVRSDIKLLEEELGRKATKEEKAEAKEKRQYLTRIEEFLLQAEEKKGAKLSSSEKNEIINTIVNTGRTSAISFNIPGAAKQRTVGRVNQEMDQYYMDSVEALIDHIYRSNESIESRKAFNFTNRKKLVAEGNRLAKSKAPNLERIKEIEKELVHIDENESEGIAQFLSEEGLKLTSDEQRKAIQLFRARLNQRGAFGTISSVRDVMLISTLGSPTAAITQLQDPMWSVYYNGPINTLQSIFGKRRMSKKDFDLERNMKEFNTGSSKWVDKALKFSGLSWTDLQGKEIYMEAALKKAEGMSRDKFVQENSFKFDNEEITGKVWDKITADTIRDKEGNLDEDVKYYVFNELSNVQPITMSETPVGYLGAGNARIFYTLKTFQIKQLSSMIREIKYAKNKKQAITKFSYLVALLTLAGASADEMKDLLMGRTNTFGDNVHENLLKLVGMSKYTIKAGPGRTSVKKFLSDILIPPVGFIGDPMEDMYKAVHGEASYETLKSIPWGAPVYSRLTEKGREKSLENERRDLMGDFRSKIEAGGNISGIRRRIEKYNSRAEDKIQYARTKRYLERKIAKEE